MAKRGPGCIRVAILVVLAPILFGLGLLLVSNVNRVLTHDTAQGTIVDLLYSTDSDGDPSYTPVYEYVVDGQTYLHESGVSFAGSIVPSIGDTRTILYNPSDPTDSRVNNVFLLVWLPVILMVIPVLIAIGVFWGIRRRLRIREQAAPWVDASAPSQAPGAAGDAAIPPWEPPGPTTSSVIEATFMGTEPSQMDDKGNVRYRVKARTEIDGEIVRFRSEWMDEDPTLFYMQHGNKVEVRLNPDDPAVYEVVLPDGS
jgi:hypothetical protein